MTDPITRHAQAQRARALQQIDPVVLDLQMLCGEAGLATQIDMVFSDQGAKYPGLVIHLHRQRADNTDSTSHPDSADRPVRFRAIYVWNDGPSLWLKCKRLAPGPTAGDVLVRAPGLAQAGLFITELLRQPPQPFDHVVERSAVLVV